MKNINMARKAQKDAKPPDDDAAAEPEVTRPRQRKGARNSGTTETPVKTPARRVRRKGKE